MIKTFNLKPSPSTARKLLVYNSLSGLPIDEHIQNLAAEELLSPEDISKYTYDDVDSKILDTIQYVSDFGGRTIILSEDLSKIMISFILYTRLRNKNSCIIVANDISKMGGHISRIKDCVSDINIKVIPDITDISKFKFVEQAFSKNDVLVVSKTFAHQVLVKKLNSIMPEAMLFLSGDNDDLSVGSTTVFPKITQSVSFGYVLPKNAEQEIISWDLVSKLTAVDDKKIVEMLSFLYSEDFFFKNLLLEKKLIEYGSTRNYDYNKILIYYLSGISIQLI